MAPKNCVLTTASANTGLGGGSAAVSTLAPKGLSAGSRKTEITGGSVSLSGVTATARAAAGALGGGVVAVGACPKRAAHVAHPAVSATPKALERNLMVFREV